MRASTQQTYRPTKFRRTSYLVKRLENAVREMLEVALADRDVTLAQYTLLSMFSDVDGMSSADAARRCGVSKQASNEIINVLEAKRLISRRPAGVCWRPVIPPPTAASASFSQSSAQRKFPRCARQSRF